MEPSSATDVLSAGSYAAVSFFIQQDKIIRRDRVLKWMCRLEDKELLVIEQTIYERLGHQCQYIVRYHGPHDGGIVLEFCEEGALSQYLQKSTPSTMQCLKWADQIIRALSYCHSKGVVHGDLCCNNIFLTKKHDIKLGDFGGSSIDGSVPLVCYSTSYDYPNPPTLKKGDQFALGSTLYEMVVGRRPYHDLDDDVITKNYQQHQFPNVDSLATLQKVIRKCWYLEYSSVDQALTDLWEEGTFSQ